MGDTLSFHVLLEAREEVEQPRAGIRFFDRLGNLVFGCGTFQLGVDLPRMAPGERRVVRFEVRSFLRRANGIADRLISGIS